MKTFPASLRTWQGYKTVDGTGNFTVNAVEDKTNGQGDDKVKNDYTVQMPSKSGYSENTKYFTEVDTHILLEVLDMVLNS